MMKCINLTIILNLIVLLGFSQSQEKPTTSFDEIAIDARLMNSGYSKSTSGKDFAYQSVIGGNTKCLIARANDTIEWEAKAVTKNNGFYEFLWLAAIDVAVPAPQFTLKVNGQSMFTFKQDIKTSWSIDGADGSRLTFYVQKLDMHEDAHGYMYLKVPENLITSDVVSLSIEGDKSGSHSWFMTFKETTIPTDIYGKAVKEMKGEVSFVSDATKVKAQLALSKSYTEKKAHLIVKGQTFDIASEKFPFEGTIELPFSSRTLAGETYQIVASNSTLIAEGQFGQNDEYASVRPNENTYITYQNQLKGDTFTSEFTIKYAPKMVENVVKVSQLNMTEGTVALMNSSHQDIAWMDTPEKCIVERDTMLITPIINDALKLDEYSFDIEDALMIQEYIDRHPESKEKIVQLLNEEKISVGASYTQPYEEMYSGESLSRQFIHGKKYLAELLDGYNADTYWNMDVPGRTLQMPQIMAKSGVNKLVISRQEKGIFKWEAPNGDDIIVFSLDHYSLDFLGLNQTLEIATNHVAEKSLEWTKDYNSKDRSKAIIPILSDWDMSPAKDYTAITTFWNQIKFIEQPGVNRKACVLPKIKLMTTDKFVDLIYENSENLKTIKGERPNLWVYIHGPSHQKAVLLSRTADKRLVGAEKLSAFHQLIDASSVNYPQKELYQAWENKIYPDHGWGGKNGDITDAVFKEKYNNALHVADAIYTDQAKQIAGHINFKKKGVPMVIFNHLNWNYDNIIEKEVSFNENEIKHFSMIDADGKPVKSQLTEVERYNNGYLKSAKVHFIGQVPALGYTSYYVVEGTENHANADADIKKIETDYYSISLGNGGIESLIKKSNDEELIDNTNFLGGEVFFLTSEGNGAGEFVKVQHPTLEDFEQLKDKNINWTISNKGDIFTDYSFRQKLGDGVVEETIRVYQSLEKIDFAIDVKNWEGTMYREYRVAFPVNNSMKTVEYQVPYGVLEVGKDEAAGAAGGSAQGSYTTPNKDIHPRGIENWIAAKSDNSSLVVTSSVAAADYYDVLDKEKITLQPILFASRHSCHWEGNPYPQTGNHAFKFSLSTGDADRITDNQNGIENAEQLEVVFRPQTLRKPSLKATQQFISMDNENIVVTAIKKAEDSDALIIRFYNVSDQEETVNIDFQQTIKSAFTTTILEEDMDTLEVDKNKVKVNTEAFGITTLKVNF
ncbi:hypothetical protein KMW28_03690 [Flammeovirga yaeyamensis]|uniref:Alpha-mannosidase n=1 Tax=Flammeovirga yaeyamensis TaxID=367791 RepID=A0AAX1N5X6_9BACT|nr:glycosyl hydrolase-related protein [Flammeovirga yaeyamensis]MBB3701250.1 alpha-mannosidase [Flammeovirga yaeyamensis]NMF38279.1 hypothetical protein [Flammeovirga yaeyamensis]QWG02691.1 hypothetical protein KMW28_03690 [Flammeovirga yaeyamensis]